MSDFKNGLVRVTDREKEPQSDDDPHFVWRGGSWHGDVQNLRLANRGYGRPAAKDLDLGFRLVRTKK